MFEIIMVAFIAYQGEIENVEYAGTYESEKVCMEEVKKYAHPVLVDLPGRTQEIYYYCIRHAKKRCQDEGL